MVDEVKTLINNRMKEILREEGLTVSGIKSELQIRIIARMPALNPSLRAIIPLILHRY
jgi:hypothetical protein